MASVTSFVPSFSGTPAAVGAAMAARWGAEWRGVLTRWRNARSDGGAGRDRPWIRGFEVLLRTHAPHWLEEASAFAGETLEDFLDFNSRPPSAPPAIQAGHCSSMVAVGRATADGHPLLLKIRDEAPWPQIAYRRRVAGGPAVLGGANSGNLGLAQFLNEAGLAGANNTGGPILDPSLDVGLNDCHVLRLVAERARDCDGALDVIRELLGKGALGLGGYRKGMIFFFADARGRGLLVECSRRHLAHRFLEDGLLSRANDYRLPEMQAEMDASRHAHPWHLSSLARSARIAALLGEAGPLTVETLARISRDTEGEFPLCNVTDRFPFRTVSAWIYVIRRGDPSACRAMICNVAPSLGGYVEVAVAGA